MIGLLRHKPEFLHQVQLIEVELVLGNQTILDGGECTGSSICCLSRCRNALPCWHGQGSSVRPDVASNVDRRVTGLVLVQGLVLTVGEGIPALADVVNQLFASFDLTNAWRDGDHIASEKLSGPF